MQTKLLTSWIKESRSIRSDAYFSMLYDMQSEKVNKIIFAPGLRQLRRLYKEKGFSIDFIEILFSKIGVRESHDKVNNNQQSVFQFLVLIIRDYTLKLLEWFLYKLDLSYKNYLFYR